MMEMQRPRPRCARQHSSQMRTPWFSEAQLASIFYLNKELEVFFESLYVSVSITWRCTVATLLEVGVKHGTSTVVALVRGFVPGECHLCASEVNRL